MIRVVKTGTGDAPQFFCDQCKLPIEQIDLALYLWKQRKILQWKEEQEPALVLPPHHPSVLVEEGQIYTLHKHCADEFEAQHGGDQYDWPWIELTDLLLFLTHNGGLTLEDLQKRLEARKDLWG